MVSETRRQVIIMKQNVEEEDDVRSAEVELRQLAFGIAKTAVLKCAIDLGIAEAVDNLRAILNSPVFTISSSTRNEVLGLHRIFKEKPTSDGALAFEQTPIPRRLIREGENSLAALVLLQSSPAVLASWINLRTLVLTDGTSAFKEAHGKDMWGYAACNAAQNKLFNDAMACDARIAAHAIIERCPEVFDGIETLVDVGGGNGTNLCSLVKAFPWIKGINFDLPHVVSVAEKCHGVEHVEGDMFDCVPTADAIILKSVLHDWGDDDCIKILKKCRETIRKEKGKLIIVDAIIEENEADKFEYVRSTLDMVMMANTNKGKERTLKEWEYIIRQAGFDRYNIKSIGSLQSLIEAFP